MAAPGRDTQQNHIAYNLRFILRPIAKKTTHNPDCYS